VRVEGEEAGLLVGLDCRRFGRHLEEGRLEGGSCSLWVGMPCWEAVHRGEGHSSRLEVPAEEAHSSFDGSCGTAVPGRPSRNKEHS